MSQGCRIGKVMVKGGATVIPLRLAGRGETQSALMRTAGKFLEYYPGDHMKGFVILAWSDDSTCCHVVITPDSNVGISMAPHFAEEEVRRALKNNGDW